MVFGILFVKRKERGGGGYEGLEKDNREWMLLLYIE